MIGAIAGDIIGSVYEGGGPPPAGFPLFRSQSRFTDDTVLSVAVASTFTSDLPYDVALRQWGRRYPHAGYGGWFRRWLIQDDAGPYNSFGNGSAMRVAAVGWACETLDDVLREAERSAIVTHDHAEGIKGAKAVAAAVFLGRKGSAKVEIAALLEDVFGYRCDRDMAALRAEGPVDVTCQHTVPAAAVAFLQATDFETTIRNAISLGGDTDTTACIAGALAEAFHGGVPEAIEDEVFAHLDDALRAEVLRFCRSFAVPLHRHRRA